MAWLELDPRTGIYKIGIRLADGKFKRSLKTSNPREAKSLLGTVENTLTALERGWLTLPEGVDLADFLISGGKATGKLTRPQTLKLGQLFEQYFVSIPDGSLETSTIKCMRIHERQLYRVLGKSLTVEKLTTAELQRFVDRRSKDKGLRGRPLTATTIKKAIVTLRTVWNWGIKHGIVNKSFPNSGIKYPKLAEKPHFQTRQEVEQRIARGGLSAAEQSDLWDCAFLTLPDIAELLAHVKLAARHPFIYPMFVLAAHTGMRRSEMVRSRLSEIDLTAGVITVQERKRSQAMHTTRRVPLSPFLAGVLREWIANHPGGSATFCLDGHIDHSRHQDQAVRPLTWDEAHDHFKRTLTGSQWEKLRGWHVFRHSFCSNCAASGVDQRIINAWVGHQTDAMVRRYRHLIPNQQQQAIEQVFGRETRK